MSNKYFSTAKGPYIFCDICGQACYLYDVKKLPVQTGRGGLMVCKNDVDKLDFGLVPYKIAEESKIKFTRINHTNVTNGAEPYDTESGVF